MRVLQNVLQRRREIRRGGGRSYGNPCRGGGCADGCRERDEIRSHDGNCEGGSEGKDAIACNYQGAEVHCYISMLEESA